jgi:hypothetical protein
MRLASSKDIVSFVSSIGFLDVKWDKIVLKPSDLVVMRLATRRNSKYVPYAALITDLGASLSHFGRRFLAVTELRFWAC